MYVKDKWAILQFKIVHDLVCHPILFWIRVHLIIANLQNCGSDNITNKLNVKISIFKQCNNFQELLEIE